MMPTQSLNMQLFNHMLLLKDKVVV